MGSASTTAGGRAECFSNDIREHLRSFHHGAPLGSGLQKSLLIDGGERSLAFIDDRNIRREHDHGYRRPGGFGHSRDHIGCATAAWCLGDTRLVGQAGVGIGHKRRRTLIARHDVRNLAASGIERVVKHHRGIAGYAKDVLDPVFLEQFDQNLGGIHRLSSSWLWGSSMSPLSIHRRTATHRHMQSYSNPNVDLISPCEKGYAY